MAATNQPNVLPPVEDDFELVAPAAEPQGSGSHRKAAEAPNVSNAWPTGRTTPRENLPIDPLEVARVADFGDAPSALLGTPLYALRVFRRQRALRADLVRLEIRSQELQAKCDELLADFAHELLPALEGKEEFQRALQPLRAVERLEGERIATVSAADTSFRRQIERYDAHIAELRTTQAQAEAVVVERRALLEQAEALFRRADAKHKRALIEVRAAIDVARRTLGPDDPLPSAQAAQVAELEAKAREMEPEVLRTRVAPSFAKQELLEAESGVTSALASLKKTEGEKAAATAAIQKEHSGGRGSADAQGEKRGAMVQVALAVLELKGTVPIRADRLEAISSATRAQEHAAVEAETHLRALDSHDRGRAERGFYLTCALAAFLLVAILLKAVL